MHGRTSNGAVPHPRMCGPSDFVALAWWQPSYGPLDTETGPLKDSWLRRYLEASCLLWHSNSFFRPLRSSFVAQKVSTPSATRANCLPLPALWKVAACLPSDCRPVPASENPVNFSIIQWNELHFTKVWNTFQVCPSLSTPLHPQSTI